MANLINGLGGPAGFGEITLDFGDNNSSPAIDITSIFPGGLNLLGTTYTQVYVNTDGILTFAAPFNGAQGSVSSPGDPVIAVFWANLHTLDPEGPPSPGGNSTGSDFVYWDLDAANGIFTATWDDVVDFTSNSLYAFQVQLINRGAGDFDVVFRYENMGPASAGGDGIRAGFDRFIERTAAPTGTTLPSDPGNTGVPGLYQFRVRTGGALNDTLTGTADGDLMDGLAGDDVLHGGAAGDSLYGGEGADELAGGAGNDNLAGGGGNDTASYADAAGAVTVSLALTSQQNTGGAGFDTLSGIENLVGSGYGDTLTGDFLANVLEGGAGDDTLDGGFGNDTLDGGFGNDTASYANAAGVVVSLAAAGPQNTQSAGIDTLTGFENLAGGAGDDTLTGDDSANTLDGGPGSDTLAGAGGDDRLVVDAADLSVAGGSGSDTLELRSVLDLTAAGGPVLSGIDAIELASGTEEARLTLDTSSLAIADGAPGSRVLRVSGEGVVVLAGEGWIEAGTETVGDTIYQRYTTAPEGGDTLLVTLALLNPAGQGSGLPLRLGTEDPDFLGGSVDADEIQGFGGADFLSGRGGDDVLNGGADADLIAGGPGADQLFGGAGNDILDGGTGNDVLDGGAGADHLGDTSGSNVLLGGAGSDTFTIGKGTNVATGGAGVDFYEPDLITFFSANPASDFRITDFEPGAFGDKLNLNDLLSASSGYSGNNPFNPQAGIFRLVQNGPDTLVQWDLDGPASAQFSFKTLVRLENTDRLTLTADNFAFPEHFHPDGTPVPGVVKSGDALDNFLNGTAANDSLTGFGGADILDGGPGHDFADGGDGNDTLTGGVGNDTLVGGAGNDVLKGAGEDNGIETLSGGLGDDELSARGGAMSGGGGNDKLIVIFSTASLTAAGGSGQDQFELTPYLDASTFLNPPPAANAVVITDFEIAEGDSIDILPIAAASALWGYSGGNPLNPALGFVRFIQSGADMLVQWDRDGAAASQFQFTTIARLQGVNLAAFTDANLEDPFLLNGSVLPGPNPVNGSPGPDHLNGSFSGETLNGLDGDDTIFGYGGNDIVNGGPGNDFLDGDLGNDTVNGNDGNDTLGIFAFGNDTMNGGAGDDRFFDTLGNNVLNGGDGDDFFAFSPPLEILPGFVLPDPAGPSTTTATGGPGRDTYSVFASATGTLPKLVTYRITDFAAGYGGDLLDVQGLLSHSDGYTGGNPFDASQGYFRLLQSGANTLFQWDRNGIAGGANFETVFTLLNRNVAQITSDNFTGELIIGTENDDDLVGGLGNDIIQALAGNDSLDGSVGADLMEGGSGSDIYFVDNAGDQVVETDNDGGEPAGLAGPQALGIGAAAVIESIVDVVVASVNYSLQNRAFVEHLVLAQNAVAAQSATGNTLDNKLTGNEFQNTLAGLAGADFLDGGAGGDTMAGGSGDDLFVVDSPFDVVIELAGEGFDSVEATASYTLGANVEQLVLVGDLAINGAGNALDNVITGNGAANVLDGKAGADTLIGGEGEDTYHVDAVGDVIIEADDGDMDVVVASYDGYVLTETIRVLALGGGATSGAGNALANVLMANALTSTLAGGAGDDAYFLRGVGDVVEEEEGEGTDTVSTRFSHALSENVENLSLTGAGLVNATGNAGANVLIGNARANVLDGQGGADTMRGEGGDDIYLVDAPNEVEETANGGLDTILSGMDYTLPDHVENLLLMGSDPINGTGNELNNTLTGNSGANRLEGKDGRDVLIGGAGDDTYVVDARDKVVEAQSGGEDTVETAFSYTLASYLENLTLTGDADARGIGNAMANEITGNGGDNFIDGLAGSDNLDGGGGDDTLVFDARDEAVDGGAGTDTLLITGFRQTIDLTKIDDDVFTGIEAIDLTGKGRNTLKLTAADVLALSDNGELRVDGGTTSKLIAGPGWTPGEMTGGYREYTALNGAILLVDMEILVTLS